MGFPRSLKTDEMALYALENFEGYRREVAFPPPPLPFDYEDMCLDFDVVVAEEAARNFRLPEMSQVVFLVMLLNNAVKLGILCGWLIDAMESALKEMRWSVFQVERFYPFLHHGFLPFCGTEEMANHVRETFKRHLRAASHPPLPLLEDYRDLCLGLTRPNAEEAARDFNIPEIIQATFYAMVVNDAVELFVMSRDMVEAHKSALKGLRVTKHALLEAQLRRQANLGVEFGLANDQEESSGSSDAPSPSSDDKYDLPQGHIAGPSARQGRKLLASEGISVSPYSMVFPHFLNTEQVVDYVRETFKWHFLPRPLLDNYYELFPYFDLDMAEEPARDFRICEMT
ncbi:hypothetical protein Cgig2_007514 [Carnegiea gigantea]|uniref:Uncharacterized protein n=1 Tax=Carnegiea gigantea TaxID=171969 RepID=A0A9Q1Q6U5_9CARY|nr:hypothetical protein Cgig2_007514 [Carnegiea gigantea]